jgi:hypothetical protein
MYSQSKIPNFCVEDIVSLKNQPERCGEITKISWKFDSIESESESIDVVFV